MGRGSEHGMLLDQQVIKGNIRWKVVEEVWTVNEVDYLMRIKVQRICFKCQLGQSQEQG